MLQQNNVTTVPTDLPSTITVGGFPTTTSGQNTRPGLPDANAAVTPTNHRTAARSALIDSQVPTPHPPPPNGSGPRSVPTTGDHPSRRPRPPPDPAGGSAPGAAAARNPSPLRKPPWRRHLGVGGTTRLTAEGSFNIEIAAEDQFKTLQTHTAMVRCGRAGRSFWSRIREERAGGSPAELTVRAPRG
jgi:hypothetical protein